MTPEEAWSGHKPDVAALRVFGGANSHAAAEKRKKFDVKGENCIFIGYNDRTKSYKLFNPVTGAVFISCDVQFSEDESCE